MIFVTGIDTGVGKTLVSAIAVHALGATYWKPIQAGDLHQSDSMIVHELTNCAIVPEKVRLKRACSPHAAAAQEETLIRLKEIQPPNRRPLVVEGAGGIMAPINMKETMLDLMIHLQMPVLLTARHYLGSINHTLMTLTLLRERVPILGIVYSGQVTWSSRDVVRSQFPEVPDFQIPNLDKVDAHAITCQAHRFAPVLKQWVARWQAHRNES
ncbi:MAG: dethiobiotin synthase [Acidobacteria bacterium]|nr:dethiobiotin synthase [Acidobacteriota bacterium]